MNKQAPHNYHLYLAQLKKSASKDVVGSGGVKTA